MPDARFSITDENEETLNAALRDGLRRLPCPAVSADFDARVLAALSRPPSVWEALRAGFVCALRPLLCGAACSLPLTLLALFWTLHASSVGAPFVTAPGAANPSSQTRPLDMAAVDGLLSQPNLRASSLQAWVREASPPAPAEAAPPPPPDGEPRRRRGSQRASRPRPALLTA